MVRRVVIGLLAGWIGVGATGCGGLASAGSMKVVSRGDEGASLSLDLPTRVCDAPDHASLEFFLTDLPPAVWQSGADVSGMSGVIMHIHMFIFPKAGRTPIEHTASTATVRVLVLAGGEVGVFGGGGFFTKRGSLGDARIGGSLHEATLRLIRATPGFDDRLGPGMASGGVTASHDAAQVRALRRVFNYLSSFATPLE